MSPPTEHSTACWIRPSMGALAALLVAAGIVIACDSGGSTDDPPDIAQTFTVTVENIDDSYVYSDQNNVGVAYHIDGDAGEVITLQRGERYEFRLGDGVDPNHPFYVDRTAEGQKTSPFSNGVENADATTGSVFFEVPTSAPDSLFYQCGNHVFMGGKMMIEGSSNSSTPY